MTGIFKKYLFKSALPAKAGIQLIIFPLFFISWFNWSTLQAGEQTTLLSRTLFLDAAVAGNNVVMVGERGQIAILAHKKNRTHINTPTDTTLTAVYFLDDKYGWAAGHDAVILKTADGGQHWQQVYSAPELESPLLDIWFENNHHGIAIGAYGLYLTTTDGGNTWSREEMKIAKQENGPIDPENPDALIEAHDLHLNAIARSGSGKLYIAAEAGRIYRSDDMGVTWRELPSPYNGSLSGVLPLPDETMLVFGLRGRLYRSDNAGENWTQIETRTSKLLMNAVRLQDGRIMIVGMGGTVLVSTDDGKSFSLVQLGYQHDLAAAVETDDHELVIVGDHGIENFNVRELVSTDD